MSDNSNNYELKTYQEIYSKLRTVFTISYGDEKKRGFFPIDDVRKVTERVRNGYYRNNKQIPKNSLMEVPKNVFKALKDTYLSRDSSCVSGEIGCATEYEQLEGITNMALLMYLSNRLSKGCRKRANDTLKPEIKSQYKNNERILLDYKDEALTEIIASIYVLSKTSDQYQDFFSYGNRVDDEGKPTFAIDLQYIGQLCVHFGRESKKRTIVNNAQESAKSILKRKLELGQITEAQYKEILADLDQNGVLPEYEGKLYEYVGAMPLEYAGNKVKKCWGEIDNKLPEDITSSDIEVLEKKLEGNERELYYFLIKIGAPKELLVSVTRETQKLSIQSVKNAIEDYKITETDFFAGKEDVIAAKKEQEGQKWQAKPNEQEEHGEAKY